MIIMVSGGFDPTHDGHVAMLEEASKIGYVVVALNSDDWLMRKKGKVFMPWEARCYALKSIKFVYDVISFNDDDGTVCEALRLFKPDIFANGGDRTVSNPKEHAVCVELGIKEIFYLGGWKVRSSSDLIKEISPS